MLNKLLCSFYLKVQMWELTVVLVVEVVGNARTNKLCFAPQQGRAFHASLAIQQCFYG